jgi:hypothetical protein
MTDLYHQRKGSSAAQISDEFLHESPPSYDPTLSETSYLGFNIPEMGINCEIYHWFHPSLRVMSGGIMIWRGNHTFAPQADYFDYRNYLPYPENDIADITYPTGVRVQVVTPLQELHVDFTSPDATTWLDLTCRAIMPPARRADGTHFAQAVRCTGELVLAGEAHRIDGHFTRDRSWSSPRPEDPHPIQPMTWGAAVFGDDLALHFVGPDSNDLDETAMRWGYAWRNSEIHELTRMRKVTRRGPDGITPIGVAIDLEDATGYIYHLVGESRAVLPVPFWPNMLTLISQMHYRLDGRSGYGDYQDIHYGHSLRSRS